ncbi:MAG: hypothetical protein J2P23_12995 [Microlunatus sp.]|nr:hypothetical protein [Microlunatus sp.]
MTETSPGGPPIILHIGPFKTGTTTLQLALGQNRPVLREQGVIYPGRLDHELSAATAAASGKVGPGRDLKASTDRWFGMLDEIRTADARLGILSSEYYCEARSKRIHWLIDQLGPQSQVVITLRPLAKIIGSQWQQSTQNQATVSWDDWLRAILVEPEPGQIASAFWAKHRHDLLLRRWLDVVGPDRVTVVVVDDQQPELILRSFEQILAVEPGSLSTSRPRANRSLTVEEVELVRRFNELYARSGLGAVDYTTLVRYGAIRFLQSQPVASDSHRILMPDWAREKVAELSRMIIDDIAASGARVIGPIEQLADPELMPEAGVNPEVRTVSPELAGTLAAGVVDTMARYHPLEVPDEVQAPVLTAVLRSNRVAVVHRELQDLQTKVATLESAISAEKLITEANRRDAFDELRRRVRRRLRKLVA